MVIFNTFFKQNFLLSEENAVNYIAFMIIEFSWWGICKQFSEEKSVYTLDYEYFEGHHDYGEREKNNAREKETLPNTKIETKEVWELEEQLEQ